MTPRSSSRRAHAPRTFARRAIVLATAAVIVGATPSVAGAADDESTSLWGLGAIHDGIAQSIEEQLAPPVLDETPEPPRPTSPDRQPDPEPVDAAAPEPDTPTVESPPPEVEATIVLLTDTYEWDEQSDRVHALQETLGVTADGRYGEETARVHRTALEFVGEATDTVPVPVLPPGPPASEWAALRDCESGGDYTITNPSGKYRGAYQFDRSTWDSVASRNAPQLVGVDPAAAAPADQDALALALYRERGAGPWPRCGRHLS